MAKRRSKAAKKPGKKPKKRMTMAAKGRKPRMGKRAKRAKKPTGKPEWFEAFGVTPAMMARLSNRDSIMNALVIMFVVFATLSSGIFFHTKAPQQAMTVAPVALPHK